MLDILIILVRKLNFVTLRHNRFLKIIFETTLHCTLCTVGETYETILSITGGDLEPLHVRRNSLFSPGILKFSTKHKDISFTLKFSKVSRTFLFIFHAGSRGLGSKNFQNSSYKEKTKNSRFGPCFQTIFPFLMTMVLRRSATRSAARTYRVYYR